MACPEHAVGACLMDVVFCQDRFNVHSLGCIDDLVADGGGEAEFRSHGAVYSNFVQLEVSGNKE